MAGWDGPYKGIVEYRPNSELPDVDVKTRTAKLSSIPSSADVLNVVPRTARAISRNRPD